MVKIVLRYNDIEVPHFPPMTDAYSPPIDSVQQPFELPEEQSFLQKCIDVAVSYRDRIFKVAKSEAPTQTAEQPKVKEYKVLDPEKIAKLQMLCGVAAGEWIGAEDVITIHEKLRSMAEKEDEIDDFLRHDPRIVLNINEARDREKDLTRPLQSELDRIIAAYMGRYLSREKDEMKSDRQTGVKIALRPKIEQQELLEATTPQPEGLPSKIISFEKAKEAHAHNHQKLEPTPMAPAQPEPKPDESDEDMKVA